MSEVTVVAIPEDDDYVWRLSSEKVPHLTVLYLGEVSEEDVSRIVEFTSHLCESSLRPFGLNVDHRGVLGDDKADVLFFTKDKRELGRISDARGFFLKDPTIYRYFNSIFQYPDWTPHLTMGYPKSPAKEDKRDYPRTSYVYFDKIAVWIDDYEGPTFQLKHPNHDLAEEVYMSEVDEMLAHFGVKGMKWGRRMSEGTSSVEVSTTVKPGQKVVAKGGKGQPPHEDAIRVATAKQKAKSSTTDSLSNKELQDLVNRMNLEQQYSRLTKQDGFFEKLNKDKKNVDNLLSAGETANKAYAFVNSPVGKVLKEVVKAKLKK